MKKLSVILSVFINLFVGFSVFSQYGNVNGRQSNANFEANLAANNMMRGRDLFQDVLKQGKNNVLKIEDIQGEPYFEKTFVNGNLIYKDSVNMGQFLMRYNAFQDEMEVSNKSVINNINKIDDISVTLKNDKYVILNYQEDDNTIKKGFFIEKKNDNNASLYLRKYITIKPAKEAKTSFHTPSPASFIEHEDYFLKFSENAPIEVKLKKNKVLNSFPDNINLLKKYVSKENLSLDNEKDLIKLIEYFNTLD